MAEQEALVLEIERQSIRGRACPRCGGKIIPSNRAVYQGSGGAASDVFPLWQCERCGYEQLSAKAGGSATAGKEAHAKKESTARDAVATKAAPTPTLLRDAKGRPIPRDVQLVLERMAGRRQDENS